MYSIAVLQQSCGSACTVYSNYLPLAHRSLDPEQARRTDAASRYGTVSTVTRAFDKDKLVYRAMPHPTNIAQALRHSRGISLPLAPQSDEPRHTFAFPFSTLHRDGQHRGHHVIVEK